MFDVINMIRAGGVFMYAILAASCVAVAVILQRAYTLWFSYRLDVEGLRDRVLSNIDQGQFGQAAQICGGSHPLQRMLAAALQRANRSEKEIRRGLEGVAVTELARFRRGTATLPQLSNLATLLGLLGTIDGLIISFSGTQGVDAGGPASVALEGRRGCLLQHLLRVDRRDDHGRCVPHRRDQAGQGDDPDGGGHFGGRRPSPRPTGRAQGRPTGTARRGGQLGEEPMAGGGAETEDDSGHSGTNVFGEEVVAPVALNLTALMDILSNLLFFLLAAFGTTIVMGINATVPVQSQDKSNVADTSQSVTAGVSLAKDGFDVTIVGAAQAQEELDRWRRKIPLRDGKPDYDALKTHLLSISSRTRGPTPSSSHRSQA